MRVGPILALCAVLWAFSAAACVAAQGHAQSQIVDGIVARVEGDIITFSELRELAAYQQLLDSHSQTDEELRSELIEQWMLNDEAAGARFPMPVSTEVDREMSRIQNSFANMTAFEQRLGEVALTSEALHRVVTRQIYLARYLDYKFRSSIQVDDAAVANYYRDHLVPELQAKGQQAPPLMDVTDQIRELLIEQGVNDRTAAWFDETKPRMKIELEPMDSFSTISPGGNPGDKQ
jgi:hypothetical protein